MCFYEFIGASYSMKYSTKLVVKNFYFLFLFKYALLQGDNMFLNALDSGLIILDPAVEFLSVENLPTVVNVACCTNLLNDFSYRDMSNACITQVIT